MSEYQDYRQPGRKRSRFPDEIRTARRKEQSKRASMAQSRALNALSHLHADDYRRFYNAALTEIAQERGSLPGDDSTV